MNLNEILHNESLRQQEFPVARETIYFAHAGVCPLPRRVAEAVAGYATRCAQGDQDTELPLIPTLPQTRELAARLIGAETGEIAIVGPTSLALSFVAGGLSIKPGENVLIYRDDYPSNVYPWMALAKRGAEVRWVQTREYGRIEPEDVLSQVDSKTRLVALASCHFITGRRIDIPGLGKALRERGILFCIDGIQTLGAFPTLAKHVDFLAADSHKWMLGPSGAGILFVRQSLQEELLPTVFGWNNVQCPNYVAQDTLEFRPHARRYEAGTHNLLGLAGLHAALGLLLEVGIDAIAMELLRKRAWLIPALEAKGCVVLNADASVGNASGIVTFYKEGTDMSALHERLEKARILTSLRCDRAGRRYLRLSPHFYNTDAELRRLLEFLG